MPDFSARERTDSTNDTFSYSMRNVKTFPPRPQPKQWYIAVRVRR